MAGVPEVFGYTISSKAEMEENLNSKKKGAFALKAPFLVRCL
jgi:hypothetical protein